MKKTLHMSVILVLQTKQSLNSQLELSMLSNQEVIYEEDLKMGFGRHNSKKCTPQIYLFSFFINRIAMMKLVIIFYHIKSK